MHVRSSVLRAATAMLTVAALATACASTVDPPAAKPTAKPTGPTEVTLAVYGPKPVIAAYKEIAARYTVAHPEVKVKLRSYASHEEAMGALRRSSEQGDPPDVFLMDHDDLSGLEADKAVRRVDDLLAEREVDFGDGYTRNGLEAFSSNAALQCMPADVSPMVVYYNPKLIELDRIAEPGRNPVTQRGGWSLDEFGRAALQARARKVRGLYVAPDLEQVAPFIWSGGGKVVDDDNKPTTLELSDGASASAIEKLLLLVRDPALTFSEKALRKKSAIDRFKDGELGMILGFRDLTPELRAKQDLTFDVMPLPKLSSGATIATMSGLCISSKSKNTSAAADLLASVIAKDSASTLAATGYVMPANLDVVNSETFLQTGQRPLNSNVFAREVRDTRLLPSSPRWPVVRKATTRQLTDLFFDPVIEPLQDRLKAVDAMSVPLFNPPESPSASPTPQGN